MLMFIFRAMAMAIISVLVVSCSMWSGASDSSSVLLSYLITSLASHITIILISTLKHPLKRTLKYFNIYIFICLSLSPHIPPILSQEWVVVVTDPKALVLTFRKVHAIEVTTVNSVMVMVLLVVAYPKAVQVALWVFALISRKAPVIEVTTADSPTGRQADSQADR